MAKLNLHADLQCELDGRSLAIHANGNTAIVSVQDWSTLLRVARLALPLSQSTRTAVDRLVAETGVGSIGLRMRERTVASIHISKGMFLSWGLPAIRLHPLAMMAAAFRQT